MTVTGYNTLLPEEAIMSKHFSSCGEITHVLFPDDPRTGICLVCIRGQGAVELNGRCQCDVEECKIVVDEVMPDDDPNIEPLNCGGLNLPAWLLPEANMTKGPPCA